jgi:hypothetical protein
VSEHPIQHLDLLFAPLATGNVGVDRTAASHRLALPNRDATQQEIAASVCGLATDFGFERLALQRTTGEFGRLGLAPFGHHQIGERRLIAGIER